MTNVLEHEAVTEEGLNPLGISGIEFIEFATSKPQALGMLLEKMGFRPIARHRSREVELYRQGSMNIVVNSQPADLPHTVHPAETPVLSAFALRVRDAEAAFQRIRDMGAWEIPVRARAMELNIPAIHGVGESLIYFVDRHDEFSIYDIDFRAIPSVETKPAAIGSASSSFGANGRSRSWRTSVSAPTITSSRRSGTPTPAIGAVLAPASIAAGLTVGS